jgi:hypothetical protein
LPDSFFRDANDLPHQDHERKKNLRNQASELLRQEDVPSSHDGENKQETAEDHQEDHKAQGEAENQGEGRMNVPQPHHGNVPEEEDENEENDTGKDEQSNENSLLRLNLQRYPLIDANIKIESFGQKTKEILTNFCVRYHKNLLSTFPLDDAL